MENLKIERYRVEMSGSATTDAIYEYKGGYVDKDYKEYIDSLDGLEYKYYNLWSPAEISHSRFRSDFDQWTIRPEDDSVLDYMEYSEVYGDFIPKKDLIKVPINITSDLHVSLHGFINGKPIKARSFKEAMLNYFGYDSLNYLNGKNLYETEQEAIDIGKVIIDKWRLFTGESYDKHLNRENKCLYVKSEKTFWQMIFEKAIEDLDKMR